MALRKLRKTLKPVIWVMTIAFLVSIFLIGAGGALSRKQVIDMKVNGKKIAVGTIERAIYQNLAAQREQYKNKVDENYIKLMTVNSVIERELLAQGSKKLHVGVSGKEVKEKYNEIIGGIGAKEAAERIRNAMNLSVAEFKKILKKEIIVQKTKEKIEDSYKATENEIKAEYENEKFATYKGKTFEDEKENIAKTLKSRNKEAVYMSWLDEKFASAKIEDVNSRYLDFMKKDVVKVGDLTIDNINFLGTTNYRITLMGKTKKEAYTDTIDEIKAEQALAMEAKKRGIVVADYVPELMKARYLINNLKKDMISKYKVDEKELKKYFDKNSKNYETKESAKLKYIQINIKESDKDIEASKVDAEKVLLEALKDGSDFAELAKKYSEGPSASKGGDLGWFGKGRMVAEFDEVAFKGEKGKVYPEIVKTRFGYHIIKIDDKKADDSEVKASHILIKGKVSDKTKSDLKVKAEALLAEIKAGKLDFDKAIDDNGGMKKEREVKKGTNPVKEINDALFAMTADEIKIVASEKAFYIVDQTAYTPFKEAKLEDSKENISFDYVNEKVNEELEDMREKLKEEVAVEILDEEIKTVLAKEVKEDMEK